MMQAERRTRLTAPSKTRYTFAATTDQKDEGGTKTCPRCGQILFEDMDVCYGCLYDFRRDQRRMPRSVETPYRDPLGRLRQVPQVVDPLGDMELDEIDEDEPRIPRHSKEAATVTSSADDTLDLSTGSVNVEPQVIPEQKEEPVEEPYWLMVSASELKVRVPVGESAISVGRDESNDIVLHERSVSRRHVRIVREKEGVLAEDLGATNPAVLGGRPLTGSVPMDRGEELDVCGVQIALV